MPEQDDNGNVIRWRIKEAEQHILDLRHEHEKLARCLTDMKLEWAARGRWDRMWSALIGALGGALSAAIAAWAAYSRG